MMTLLSSLLGAASPLWLPAFFSDNMVLQRGRPIPIWGAATPGATVEIRLGKQKTIVKTTSDGTFRAKLRAMEAGGPYELVVTDGHTTRTIDNVLVGEVWICSGQSNMEFGENAALTYDLDRRSTDTNVRMFTAPLVSKDTPQKDTLGTWVPATPDTVGSFSAVGYAFGKELFNRLHVPIGLIHTSWGGTPAEAWTSRDALLKCPATAYMVENYLKRAPDLEAALQSYKATVVPWFERAYPQDADNLGLAKGWAGTDESVDADWPKIPVPGAWETTIRLIFDGVLWLRTTVDVPPDATGRDWTLSLGPIDDTDITYFNGEKVGATSIDTPNCYATPRRYTIPARLIRPGRAVIAIRVFDTGGNGGLTGTPEDLYLESPDGDRVRLAGDWKYKIESALVTPPAAVLAEQPQRPLAEGDGGVPGGLFNAMINPFIPYAIRGAIWYQGESNADRAHEYRELFPLMIDDWRARWNQGDFPFYFVQLANYMARNDQPVESAWAELREAQFMALRKPHTGMAIAIDIGDAEDIHPKNKREVGRRLAQWALAKDYGFDIPFSGPLYKTSHVEGDHVRIRFTSTDGGLGTQDAKPARGFAIAGADRKFVWAEARIEDDEIVVWSPQIPHPVAVRYGWSDNPDVNLTNGAGIPASPFRTDDWSATP